jgi:2,3-bisphosphoglycerate-dependent phosphoglycerate mutase
MKLILLRHGESEWNLLNQFTGWTDVGLTKKGIQEAKFSAEKILQENIVINTIYTSLLLRSTHTAEIIADMINFNKEDIQYNWRLNERHYGALQGLNKSETAEKYGEDQVHIWRRSYDVAPPLLSNDDERHPRFNEKFKNIENMPTGESLKNVIDRLNPFWNQYLANIKENLGNHLIVAHSNSLRAIVKILDQLSDKEIVSVNIPTGVPLVYEFDNNCNVIHKEYLIDQAKLEKKQKMVVNQGKVQ